MKKGLRTCLSILLAIVVVGTSLLLISCSDNTPIDVQMPEMPSVPVVDTEDHYRHVAKFSFMPSEWRNDYETIVRKQSNRNENAETEWYAAEVQKLHDMRHNQPFVLPYYGARSYEFSSSSLVVWFSSDLFGLPWTYYPMWNDIMIRVAFTDVTPEASMLETIQKWNPQFPTPSDSGSAFKRVSEQTIQLKDRKVQALVTENAHFDRVTTYFMYDNMLVAVHGPTAECNDHLFSNLFFVELPRNPDGNYEMPEFWPTE